MKFERIIFIVFLFFLAISFASAININTCQTLSSPGIYNVITDLDGGGGDCIVISSDDIVVQSLDSSVPQLINNSADGVHIVGNYSNITVRYLVFDGNDVGVSAIGTGGGNGTSLTVYNNTFNNCTDYCIYSEDYISIISYNTLNKTGDSAVALLGIIDVFNASGGYVNVNKFYCLDSTPTWSVIYSNVNNSGFFHNEIQCPLGSIEFQVNPSVNNSNFYNNLFNVTMDVDSSNVDFDTTYNNRTNAISIVGGAYGGNWYKDSAHTDDGSGSGVHSFAGDGISDSPTFYTIPGTGIVTDTNYYSNVYMDGSEFFGGASCGDGICNFGENYNFCCVDCSVPDGWSCSATKHSGGLNVVSPYVYTCTFNNPSFGCTASQNANSMTLPYNAFNVTYTSIHSGYRQLSSSLDTFEWKGSVMVYYTNRLGTTETLLDESQSCVGLGGSSCTGAKTVNLSGPYAYGTVYGSSPKWAYDTYAFLTAPVYNDTNITVYAEAEASIFSGSSPFNSGIQIETISGLTVNYWTAEAVYGSPKAYLYTDLNGVITNNESGSSISWMKWDYQWNSTDGITAGSTVVNRIMNVWQNATAITNTTILGFDPPNSGTFAYYNSSSEYSSLTGPFASTDKIILLTNRSVWTNGTSEWENMTYWNDNITSAMAVTNTSSSRVQNLDYITIAGDQTAYTTYNISVQQNQTAGVKNTTFTNVTVNTNKPSGWNGLSSYTIDTLTADTTNVTKIGLNKTGVVIADSGSAWTGELPFIQESGYNSNPVYINGEATFNNTDTINYSIVTVTSDSYSSALDYSDWNCTINSSFEENMSIAALSQNTTTTSPMSCNKENVISAEEINFTLISEDWISSDSYVSSDNVSFSSWIQVNNTESQTYAVNITNYTTYSSVSYSGWANPTYAYDVDWSTAAAGNETTNIMYLNYTTDTSVTNASLMVKYNNSNFGSTTTNNYTIPDACFSGSIVEIKVQFDDGGVSGTTGDISCNNGSSWVSLASSIIKHDTHNYLFETAIYWGSSVNITSGLSWTNVSISSLFENASLLSETYVNESTGSENQNINWTITPLTGDETVVYNSISKYEKRMLINCDYDYCDHFANATVNMSVNSSWSGEYTLLYWSGGAWVNVTGDADYAVTFPATDEISWTLPNVSSTNYYVVYATTTEEDPEDPLQPVPPAGGGSSGAYSNISVIPGTVDKFVFYFGSIFGQNKDIIQKYEVTKPVGMFYSVELTNGISGNALNYNGSIEVENDVITSKVTIPYVNTPKIISGRMTVSSTTEAKAVSITYRIINLGAVIKFPTPIKINPYLLSPLFLESSSDNQILGLRWWVVIAAIALVGAVLIIKYTKLTQIPIILFLIGAGILVMYLFLT